MNRSECMECFLWTAIMCCFRCVHSTAQEIPHARRAIHALLLIAEDRTIFHYLLSKTERRKSQISFSQLSSDSKENQNIPKTGALQIQSECQVPTKGFNWFISIAHQKSSKVCYQDHKINGLFFSWKKIMHHKLKKLSSTNMNWIQKATWNKSDQTILYVGHTWDTGKMPQKIKNLRRKIQKNQALTG